MLFNLAGIEDTIILRFWHGKGCFLMSEKLERVKNPRGEPLYPCEFSDFTMFLKWLLIRKTRAL